MPNGWGGIDLGVPTVTPAHITLPGTATIDVPLRAHGGNEALLEFHIPPGSGVAFAKGAAESQTRIRTLVPIQSDLPLHVKQTVHLESIGGPPTRVFIPIDVSGRLMKDGEPIGRKALVRLMLGIR